MALAMQQQADIKRKQLFEVYGALNPRIKFTISL